MIIFMSLYEYFGEWFFRGFFALGIVVWLFLELRFSSIFSFFERVLFTYSLSFLMIYFIRLEDLINNNDLIRYVAVSWYVILVPFFYCLILLIIQKALMQIRRAWR